jgi:hypothetical protein
VIDYSGMLDSERKVGTSRYTDRSGGMLIRSVHPIVIESEFLMVTPDFAQLLIMALRMHGGWGQLEESGQESGRIRSP